MPACLPATARWGLFAVLWLTLVAAPPAAEAFDQVSLQLNWRHQFEFAGFYAALEHGFYAEAGLDVEIRAGGVDIDATGLVGAGRADFAVCTSNVLRRIAEGLDLVVLAVIHQHSAPIILVARRSGISSVPELKGRRLMDSPNADEIAAMLKHEGVDYESLPRLLHESDPRNLVNGKADAMIAYSTNEPYILEELGVPYQTFSPRSSGIDFYGDNLCTSAREIAAHPDRVRAFRAASLKGWDYALAHKPEIVDLIRRRYSQEKSRNALLFEANQTELLIDAKLVQLGEQSQQHWQSIMDTYHDLGMLAPGTKVPDTLIYRAGEDTISAWWKEGLLGLAMVATAAFFLARRIAAFPNGLRSMLRTPRLGVVMSVLFVCLSIPILVFILVWQLSR